MGVFHHDDKGFTNSCLPGLGAIGVFMSPQYNERVKVVTNQPRASWSNLPFTDLCCIFFQKKITKMCKKKNTGKVR